MYVRWKFLNHLYAQRFIRKCRAKRNVINEFVEKFGHVIPSDPWLRKNLYNIKFIQYKFGNERKNQRV